MYARYWHIEEYRLQVVEFLVKLNKSTVLNGSLLVERRIKMLKLQDFAREKGVTDKAIYKHLQKHAAELDGHIEKRGKNGTWLDEYAQEYISGLMITNPTVVADNSLQRRIDELEQRIERKDIIIERMQNREADKDELIDQLRKDKLLLEQKTDERIDEAVRKAEDALSLQHKQEEQKLKEELERERAEKEQVKAELETERNKGFLKRLFGR